MGPFTCGTVTADRRKLSGSLVGVAGAGGGRTDPVARAAMIKKFIEYDRKQMTEQLSHIFNGEQMKEVLSKVGRSIFFNHLFVVTLDVLFIIAFDGFNFITGYTHINITINGYVHLMCIFSIIYTKNKDQYFIAKDKQWQPISSNKFLVLF